MPDAPRPSSIPGFPPALGERYRPLGLLGAGGMGAVYAAEDRQLGRKVAIKLLARAADEAMLARMEREAQTLAALDHPHVVHLFAFDRLPEGPYMVMELLEGLSLLKYRGDGALDLMLQVAEGLAEAHRHGILHRDIKPGNVVVTAGDRAVLIDFGLAKDENSRDLTATGSVFGTLGYLAPELIRGGKASTASDWYGWGATLYALLEHRLPYRPEDAVSSRAGAPLPTAVFERLDPTGPEARLLLACLDPVPTQRPGSVAAIRKLLGREAVPVTRERTVADLPELVVATPRGPLPPPPPGVLPLASRPRPRPRRRAALAGLAAFLVTGAAVALLAPARRPALRPTPEPSSLSPSHGPWRPALETGEAAERELEALSEAGRLDRDPLAWAGMVEAMPSLARFLAWVAAGGRAETLDAPVLERLRSADAVFSRYGLPRPFFPFAHVGPSRQGRPLEGRILGYLPFGSEPPAGPTTGWLATFTDALARCAVAYDGLGKSLKEVVRELALEDPTVPQLGGALAFDNSSDRAVMARLSLFPEFRIRLARKFRAESEDAQLALYAAARSLREQPATAELVGLLVGRSTSSLEPWLGAGFACLPIETILPGARLSPPAALAAATVLVRTLKAQHGHVRGELGRLEEARSMLALAQEPPGPEPFARHRYGRAVDLAITVEARQGGTEALARARQDLDLHPERYMAEDRVEVLMQHETVCRAEDTGTPPGAPLARREQHEWLLARLHESLRMGGLTGYMASQVERGIADLERRLAERPVAR